MAETGRSYCLFETAIGIFGAAWTGDGLSRLQLPERDRRATEERLLRTSERAVAAEPSAETARAIAAIRRYLNGERTELSGLRLDLGEADPFFRKVYEAARRIGWGQTATYGALAKAVGSPRDTREVGQALARNPIAIIIPCHRVLAKGMKIGGFSAYGGVLTKQRLLALENVDLDAGAPLLPGLLPEPPHRQGL